MVAASPANAYSVSCTNSGCSNAAAWGAARYQSWWFNDIQGTNTPGANCTNYAAWKLIQNGTPKPSMNLGNANTWDDRAAAMGFTVNHTPAVGAIAQWNSGEFGHVAYVEAVSGNTVTISESNWNGTWLQWRTMTVGEVENFVHINDVVQTPPPTPPATAIPAVATKDFNGDGAGDVFRVTNDGILWLYPGNGQGGFATQQGIAVGSGWGATSKLIAPGDFTGDGNADVLGVGTDGSIRLYPGNGQGGWLNDAGALIGSSWDQFTRMLAPGDFDGDGKADVIGIRADGTMHLFAGNGSGGWVTGFGVLIGSGWNSATKVFSTGDFTGDAKADVLAVMAGGDLKVFPGDGHGGWINAAGISVGTGWDVFSTLTSAGDFTGDTKPDVLGVKPDGTMLLYRGNGVGGWITGIGEQIGSGWVIS